MECVPSGNDSGCQSDLRERSPRLRERLLSARRTDNLCRQLSAERKLQQSPGAASPSPPGNEQDIEADIKKRNSVEIARLEGIREIAIAAKYFDKAEELQAKIDKLKLVGTVGTENPEANATEDEITADGEQQQKNEPTKIDMALKAVPSHRRKVKVKRQLAKPADTAEKESVNLPHRRMVKVRRRSSNPADAIEKQSGPATQSASAVRGRDLGSVSGRGGRSSGRGGRSSGRGGRSRRRGGRSSGRGGRSSGRGGRARGRSNSAASARGVKNVPDGPRSPVTRARGRGRGHRGRGRGPFLDPI